MRGSRPESPFGKVVANVATCTFARVWVVVTYPGNLEQISHSSYVQMVARAQPVLWVGVVSFDPMDWKYVPLGDRLNTVTMEREAVPTQSGNLMCHVAKTLPRMALCPRLIVDFQDVTFVDGVLEDVLPCYQITRDRDVCSCLDQRVEPAKAIIRELECFRHSRHSKLSNLSRN